ncbi:glycosyltransferase family 4 protein [Amycolatopsis suaedae]|uniref:glycosyltransferase family 4 protein n=1 Tax=Amycolatopsis suaedae TaxID=2510978 RepID=UPI001F0D538B|nr:glycosyltransferase family 4 protein [Amycolatopsis suaedae]
MHFVLPGDVDDPAAASGGNVYDRRISAGLAALGADVREHAVPGSWPRPDARARARLAESLAGIPDGAVVLLDGLVAGGVPDVVVPHAGRLRLAVLVHLPLAEETGLDPATAAELDAAERACLRAAAAVVATGPAAAGRLARRHRLSRVHTVVPGTDPAPLAPGTDGVSGLLCVASVTPRKGHDVLVAALAEVAGLPWTCTCAGPPRDAGQAARVAALARRAGIGDRVLFPGPLTGVPLERAYAAADLFVLASRAETYGMVVTEALARGIPVVASGVADALGEAGLLVPPGDAAALAAALRRWFTDEPWRKRLRSAARERRSRLPGWDVSAGNLAAILVSLRA